MLARARLAGRLLRCVCLAAVLWECSADLSIPAGAKISCARDADCPANMLCHPTTTTCVARQGGGLDTVAPSVLSATLTPELARAGVEVEAHFVVSEALFQTPSVSFPAITGPVFFACDADDETTFSCRYTPDGSEVEGLQPLSVELVDRGGNSARSLLGVNVIFDFTPPDVVAGTASVQLGLPSDPATAPTAITYGTEV